MRSKTIGYSEKEKVMLVSAQVSLLCWSVPKVSLLCWSVPEVRLSCWSVPEVSLSCWSVPEAVARRASSRATLGRPLPRRAATRDPCRAPPHPPVESNPFCAGTVPPVARAAAAGHRGARASLSLSIALLVPRAPPRSSCAPAAASPRPGAS